MSLLLALLVVAYIGSLWAAARGRSFGSPSGAEYVVLGCLLGPRALGVVGDEALASFEPVAHVALGWIALGYGLECGLVGERPAPLRSNLLAIAVTTMTACTVAGCVYWVANRLGFAGSPPLPVLAVTLGLVSAETTRHALRRVSERHEARGPLSELVAEVAAADDALVLVGLSFLFAVATGPLQVGELRVPEAGGAAATLAVGVVLGGALAWLLARAPRHVEWWTLLLGGAWIATGAATRVGLSAMAATFAMGLTLSIASREAPRLRALVLATEGPVLLPALLLAGAHLGLPHGSGEALIVAGAIGGRVVSSLVMGTLMAGARKSTRAGTRWLGLGLLSSGTLTMMVAFSVQLREGGMIGRLALLTAAGGTLLGELFGPFALRRALRRAGELQDREPVGDKPAPGAQEVAS
jgi:hypothetical protein